MVASAALVQMPRAAVAAAAVLLLAGPAPAQNRAQAQTPPAAQPQPPAVPATPDRTTAAFGDWVLRCERTGEGTASVRICEVGQSIQVQGQGAIAQIAIGRVSKGEPLKLTIVLQPNISFPSTIKVAVDEKDTQPLELGWRRCLPGACIADGTVTDQLLQKYRARTEPGRFTFKDAGGRDVALPLSFRGLAQGLDALAKE